ncbi:uncharacterized protein LOC113520146 [Galleria mellonella]|uniref:Uncharacterized protein LOC113520146 n=1 Tax=Galleria mellonella TaxID=7137 RepID=A0A6J1X544_GALME|nr:uncharacterized protein LOC113520146 [Galleria mellonella]
MEEHVSLAPSPRTPSGLFAAEKKFIYVYKNLPILWDSKHPQYSNKYQRHEALQTLLQVYKLIKPAATVNDVRMKINTLRSNYRRELKKVILSRALNDSSTNVYKPKTWSFELLSFLSDEVHISTDQNTSTNECNDIEEIEIPFETEISTSPVPDIGEYVETKPSTPKRKIIKIDSKSSRFKKSPIHHSCYCCTHLMKIRNSITRIWVDKLENLDSKQRLIAEKAINDVLFEAEMGTLNRYSVKINEPTEECSSPYTQYFVSSQHDIQSPDEPSKISKEESILSSDIGEHVVVLSQE